MNARILHVLPVLVLVLLAFASQTRANGSEVLGRYWLPDHDGQIEIYRQADLFHGRVVSYDISGQLDEENPNPVLRARPFVGIVMLSNFQFEANSGRWVNGTIYDAASGKSYDCTMWFEEGEPNVLMARGFVGFSFLGRTERFVRVEPEK